VVIKKQQQICPSPFFSKPPARRCNSPTAKPANHYSSRAKTKPERNQITIRKNLLTTPTTPSKKCPPQETSLFAYFFGVEKSTSSDGTRPVGLDFAER
jgi:hypothetical protein